MKKLALSHVGLMALLAGCGDGQQPAESEWVPGFNPPALQAGYERFTTPKIENIQPGEDRMWCQWLRAPDDRDMDISELNGNQSAGGHHIVLYATTIQAPVGMTRDCKDSDLVSVRFLGGIGGEAAAAITAGLPKGVVFRVPKGHALMANVHYVNAGRTPLTGQGYLDVKFSTPDPSAKLATLFVNVDDEFRIPLGSKHSADVNCTVQEPLNILYFGNHMHEWGTSAYTEIIRPNGEKVMARRDTTWDEHQVFNPDFDRWPIESPLIINKGDVVHTHCEWNNTSGHELKFPNEMCVGFGIMIGTRQLDCTNGQWPTGPT